jgi:hypothetical protein
MKRPKQQDEGSKKGPERAAAATPEAAAGTGSAPYTRWAAFEHAVLAKLKNPDEVRATILERQREVDDERYECELVAAYIRRRLKSARYDPDTACVFMSTAELTEWLELATGDRKHVTRTTPYLTALAIPELRRSTKDGVHGWIWRGATAPRKATAEWFDDAVEDDEEDDLV